jgi:hypothetical protein
MVGVHEVLRYITYHTKYHSIGRNNIKVEVTPLILRLRRIGTQRTLLVTQIKQFSNSALETRCVLMTTLDPLLHQWVFARRLIVTYFVQVEVLLGIVRQGKEWDI